MSNARLHEELSLIDHFNLPVLDLTRSQGFYTKVLATLGARYLAQDGAAVGYGDGTWAFGIVTAAAPIPRLHVAFQARSRAAVEAFFHAALAAGGKSNGSPGLRRQYDPDYYAAFVLDPDGHNIEAVYRGGAGATKPTVGADARIAFVTPRGKSNVDKVP